LQSFPTFDDKKMIIEEDNVKTKQFYSSLRKIFAKRLLIFLAFFAVFFASIFTHDIIDFEDIYKSNTTDLLKNVSIKNA
jgi:hypothetical protein